MEGGPGDSTNHIISVGTNGEHDPPEPRSSPVTDHWNKKTISTLLGRQWQVPRNNSLENYRQTWR